MEELLLVVPDRHIDAVRARSVGERRRSSGTLVLHECAEVRTIRGRRTRVAVADARADELLGECVGRGRESGADQRDHDRSPHVTSFDRIPSLRLYTVRGPGVPAVTIRRVLDPKVFKAYDVRGVYPAELDEDGAYAI